MFKRISCEHIKTREATAKSRLYVHLSADYDTAIKVGSRHGQPVVYEVNAGAMAADGYDFYLSANGVWLTKRVPIEYLKKLGAKE